MKDRFTFRGFTFRNKEVVKLEGCNHKFHLECLNNVEGRKCPLCRKPMKYGKAVTV